MLKTISPLISPELLKVLAEMGHGDEIVFGDANFPAASMGRPVIHLEGSKITDLMEAIMPYFPLDDYVTENVILMSVVEGKGEKPMVWEKYKNIIEANDEEGSFHGFSYLERQEFYERAKKACAIVATNEREKYANIILKLGVVEGE